MFKKTGTNFIINVNYLNNKINNRNIKLIDVMPKIIPSEAIYNGLNCDFAAVQAARVSYGNGTKKKNTDKNLVKYLWENKHTSPFEMIETKWRIKCPIFVSRQWLRHRTASVNEISGRYSLMEDNFYFTESFMQSSDNKQGRDITIDVPDNIRKDWFEYINSCHDQYKKYQKLVDNGVAKELARIGLPMNLMTEFYWKIDLHNLVHFLKLRDHSHAQKEIRDYAITMKEYVKLICPISYKANF